MPSATTESLELLTRLTKEYGIEFVGDLPRSEWPKCHEETFANVVKLGERKYETFATEPNLLNDQPWKVQVKTQADRLVQKARRCRQRNESSWRFACEPVIFARLEAEVACKNCRKRVWRSEIESTRHETSATAEAFRKRQRNREPCRCSRMERSQDYLEAAGLNRIFGHREDEQVRLDVEVAKKMHKDSQRPDAIFGLRQTRNIENFLNDTLKRDVELEADEGGKQLHELLGQSPVTQTGDQLLFPFLVVEAKSGASNSEWDSIQMQTAFPIKAFLDTQNRLRRATGQRSRWGAGPLVWFFANQGDDWRVSAAYLEQRGPRAGSVETMDYVRVIDLWGGSISTYNGALQLLFLVDYVFDWARDVYREHIIQELRALASGENDAASIVYSDSDIYSTRQHEDSGVSGEEDNEEFQAYISRQQEFTVLDSADGVLRHATFIEARYCCVLITPDNVQTLLQSTKQERTQHLSRVILGYMLEAVVLDLSTLNAMEEQWTGTSPLSPHVHLPETDFYSVVSCTNYLSGNWHQVRELYTVAIAKGAWDAIVDASKLDSRRGKAKKPISARRADKDSMLTTLKRLQAGSLAETLLAAITRRAVKIETVRSRTDVSTTEVSSAVPCIVVPDDSMFREIVDYLYKSFRKGILEPQEPFMRVSKRFSQQHLLRFDVDPIETREEPLQPSDNGCVLISSPGNFQDSTRSKSEMCAYLVGGEPASPTQEQLLGIFKHTFETRDVYHTTQDNGTSNIIKVRSIGSSRVPWNLHRTYGIWSGSFHTERFLLFKEGNIVPVTQGSLRESAESGSYLFARNLVPWQDWRRQSDDYLAENMFTIYKLMTNEISYWKNIAEQRTAQGIHCCRICAAITEESNTICSECTTALKNSGLQDWLKNAAQGKPAFPEEYYEERDSLSKYVDFFNLHPPKHKNLETENHVKGWRKQLAGYPKLDEPFANLADLAVQWMQFKSLTMERGKSWGKGLGQKRKRPEEGGEVGYPFKWDDGVAALKKPSRASKVSDH